MRLHCVLRSGGDYGPEHVVRLRDQLARHTPGAELVCLSDVLLPDVPTVLIEECLPGWWAKMHLFSPLVPDRTVHYVDLDVTIMGDISPLLELRELVIMRDVYRPGGLQSAVMVLPQPVRRVVWSAFSEDPERHMERHRMGGDQIFLETLLLNSARRLQDVLPDFLESYKASVRRRGAPAPDTRLVVHHGSPRPWEVGQ